MICAVHPDSTIMNTMKNHLFRVVVTLALAATRSLAAPVTISFEGDSTLHRFSGVAENHATEVSMSADGNRMLLVTIPVRSLDTGHEGRDEQMREMFDAEHFPEIRGSAKVATMMDSAQAMVPVELTIRNQTRIIEARKDADATDPAGNVRLSWNVSLSSFGLKAPTVIGLIRVYDEVKVTAVFSPETLKINPAPAAE